MTIQNQNQLENTRKKLRSLEEHYAELEHEETTDKFAREVTKRSVRKMINQLKEEIVRYQSRSAARHASS